MSEIVDEILKHLPKEKIKDLVFEGANIVLYTNDANFFLEEGESIKKIVNIIKKRIELRPDPSLCLEKEITEKKIKEILPEESGITSIIFDPMRSIVYIEVEKPGVAIGKKGENLLEIKKQTLWVPIMRRTPPIKSELIENIRAVLYQFSEYRREFLNKVGHRVYNGWLRKKKEEWIRVTYLGAGREVGRSAILLQTPESRILLDCGINVAAEAQPYPHLETPEFRLEELDAIILSHAHIDHSGFIPYLYKMGFKGPTYCTEPTRDITALLQLDMVKIQIGDGKNPIYTSEDIKEFVKHTITLNYEEVTDITPDVRLTFYNAGHILGSAMIHLHIGNGLHNILYTSDLKFGKTRLLSPAAIEFPRLETLMIESTYGGKENIQHTENVDDVLSDIIVTTIKRKGKILLPTLGSGRAQEVIVLVQQLINNKDIEQIPIYIDGLVWDITAIYTAYPEYLNSTIRQDLLTKKNNPFLAENIKRIGSQKERQELVEEEGPCIIIATSGMLVGGPSVFYLKELVENPRNSLVFSCYQGEGTLGKRILSGATEFNYLEGSRIETVQIKMEVHRIELSSHSDRKELIDFVKRCSPRPKKVIINHGEGTRSLDLAKTIHQTFRIETVCPRNLDSIRIK